MPHKFVPCFYYPTTVVSIDDDKEFLQLLKFGLGKEIQNIYFDCPQQAQHFLKSHSSQTQYIDQILLSNVKEEVSSLHVDINIPHLMNQMYNQNRFNEVSVVLVDHAMPSCNGIEICKHLKNLNYQSILLTGYANEQNAIHYFNKNVIKRYIRKDTPEFIKTINKTIQELQLEYFQNQSRMIIHQIEKLNSQQHAFGFFLTDGAFYDLFFDIVKQHNIIEYYLIDKMGNFLMLNDNREILCLLVKSEGDMQAADDIVHFNKSIIPKNIYDGVLRREMLLHFFQENEIDEANLNWASVSFNISKGKPQAHFYYALLNITNSNNRMPLEFDRIAWYYPDPKFDALFCQL